MTQALALRPPESMPHYLLGALLALLVALSLGPLIVIMAMMTIGLLATSRMPSAYAVGLALMSACTGMLIYRDMTAWLSTPVEVMWQFYAAHSPGGLFALFTAHSALANLFDALGHAAWQWARTPFLWALHAPAGVCVGALTYSLFQIASRNPLGELKRHKSLKQRLGKVGDLPAAVINQRTAATASGSLIGIDRYAKPIELTDKAANQHTLVLGTTGSGKTVTVCNIVESAINRAIPLIYIDGKGDYDLACRVARFGQKQGRPVSLFAMTGDSIAYNPLATGGFTSKKDRIIELREWSEEHYKKLAEGYLQSVFKVMELCRIPCNLMSLSEHLDLKKLKALVRKHEKTIPDAQALMDELNHQDEASKHIESLVAEIRNFTTSEIGHLFKPEPDKPTLTLKQTLEDNGIAYFCLPALEFPSMARTLGRLVINDLKATVAQQLSGGQTKKLYVIFDEFSVFAGEQVLNVINMGRSAGIHAVLSTQSLSDLTTGHKENAEHFINQVIGNCNNFILHRQNSADDADKLAAMIGTRYSLEYTAQVSQVGPTHMGTVRRTRGFIAHPDEIKTLKTGEAFFFSKAAGIISRMRARKSWI